MRDVEETWLSPQTPSRLESQEAFSLHCFSISQPKCICAPEEKCGAVTLFALLHPLKTRTA
eukprot:4798512-Amphidinium_carterae.1